MDIPHDFNCHRFSHCLPTWMHVHSFPNNRWTNQLTIQDFYFDRMWVKEKERERDGKSKYSQTHRLFKLCNEVLSLHVNLVILYSLPIPCANLTNNRQNGLTINQLSHDLRIELFISHLMGHHYYYWARTCANKFCSWKVKYPSTCGCQLF